MAGMPDAGPSGLLNADGIPGPIRKRRFSSAKIQPTRVKKVMQSDEEIGRMVASVPVAIGRAMEHFAEKFLQAAAQAVNNTTARTLSPAHMKMAMLANPHFMFLEPLLRDVGLPQRTEQQISAMAATSPVLPPQQMAPFIPQPVENIYAAAAPPVMSSMDMAPPPSFSQAPIPESIPPVVASPRVGRRASNGEKGPAPEKRPRGRPRKIKRDRCEDDLLQSDNASVSLLMSTPAPVERNDADRMLMPPPSLPIRLPPQ